MLKIKIFYIFFLFMPIESQAGIKWTLYKDWPASSSLTLKNSSFKFDKNGFHCEVKVVISNMLTQQRVIACNIDDVTVRETISCSSIVKEEQISSFVVEKGINRINPNLRCVSDGI